MGQMPLHKRINWVSTIALVTTPILAVYSFFYVSLCWQTALWSVIYYFITGFGITAGYHRYWAHRSYDASYAYQLFMMFASSGAAEGSIKWWSRGHRTHHRYTDTDKDPYSTKKGLFHAHMMWMILKDTDSDGKLKGRVDMTDLNNDALVRFQHKYFLPLMLFMAFTFPTLVAGLGWGDWKGGFFWAGVTRLVFVHHATFCVNSLAHWLGEHTYDDRATPRDHFFTAIMTLGEGYHNFHHEFPNDFRNAIKFWQYDPTKWLIWVCSLVGLTYNLNTFPNNEIQKGRIQMQQKKIDALKAKLDWGPTDADLPKWDFDTFIKLVKEEGRRLLIIEGQIYDVEKFIDHHPGGRMFIKSAIGRDVTNAFNGGVYFHHNAARNLLQRLRVGVLKGEVPSQFVSKDE